MTNDKKENLIDISTGFGKPRPLAVGKVHYLYKWATIILFTTTVIFATLFFSDNSKKELKDCRKNYLERDNTADFSSFHFIYKELI